MTGSTFDDKEIRHSGATSATISAARRSCVRIEEREQEAHGEGLDAFRLQAMHGVPQPRLVERGDDLATIIEAFAHLLGQPLRRQQRRLLIERVEKIAARAAATNRAPRTPHESPA